MRLDVTTIVALLALSISGLSFYRSYLYTNNQLDVTVTEVSYVTNEGGLYMTVAFSNGGNRDAALLRVEPALWVRRDRPSPEWVPLANKVHPDIPVTAPKMPTIVKAGGIEVVTLSAALDPGPCGAGAGPAQGAAFLGLRVATMNSDGNLFLLQHPVARLVIDREGHPQRRAGDSPQPQRLRGRRRRAAGRSAAVEQEDTVRVGGRTVVTGRVGRLGRAAA